jgi:hypothetical protein
LERYLGRPLSDLLQREPNAPFVVKRLNAENTGREMILRIRRLDQVIEITTAFEVPTDTGLS